MSDVQCVRATRTETARVDSTFPRLLPYVVRIEPYRCRPAACTCFN